jgi:hypothetical protein
MPSGCPSSAQTVPTDPTPIPTGRSYNPGSPTVEIPDGVTPTPELPDTVQPTPTSITEVPVTVLPDITGELGNEWTRPEYDGMVPVSADRFQVFVPLDYKVEVTVEAQP